jgi:hypothetical protein
MKPLGKRSVGRCLLKNKDAKKEGRAVDLGLHLYLHDLVTIEGMLAIDRRAAARSSSSSSS